MVLPPTKNAALRRSSALALLEAEAQVEGALEAQKILKSASARQKIPDNFAPYIPNQRINEALTTN